MTMRQKMTRGVVTAGVALVVIAAGGTLLLFSGGVQAEDSGAPDPPLDVQTLTVERVDDYRLTRRYTGQVVAEQASDLSFERGGRVEELLVDKGDHVQAKQPLAVLDKRHLITAKAQVTAELAAAQALLDELVAGPRQQTIAAARAEVRDLAAQADLQEAVYRRKLRLRGQNAASGQELDEARFGAAAAKAKLDAAQRRLDELLEGTRKEQIQAQRATVDRLQARLADIELDIDDCTLRAPFAGTITERRLDEGTVVDAGTHVFSLVQDHKLEVWVGLPPESARRLAKRKSRTVEVAGTEYQATVKAIVPQVDQATRTRRVILQLSEENAGQLVPGQVARLAIDERIEGRGVWLPNTALVRGTRGLWAAIAVMDDDNDGVGRLERRDVEVLYTESDKVLTRGTLEPGDIVIASGAHRVVAGQRVRYR